MNVCDLLDKAILDFPNKVSITAPINSSSSYRSYTFSELGARVNRIANRFLELGVKPQDKVLIFLKPDIDFCAITFALFKIGAISVFIDPGMPKKMFLKCLRDLEPDVLVGIPRVHLLTWIFPRTFRSIRLFIKNTSGFELRAKSLFRSLDRVGNGVESYRPTSNDLAAILFTSGGTGPAKGVEYTHDIFINQTLMLKNEFSLNENDIDIPGFPLFSFFTLAMGMKSAIPDMDFAKPRECSPELLYKNIIDHNATFLAGSPAIWVRLADYCVDNGLTLPTVKYVTLFGAPVKKSLHEKFEKILPNGTTYTPYGATECLPVSNISGKEILRDFSHATSEGLGICVGKPLNGVQVEIINTDEAGIGEITVTSKNVTKRYYRNDLATGNSKIYKGDTVWHNMGDVGYIRDGQLWFCGRQKHVVKYKNKNFYPTQVEGIVNSVDGVQNSALVSLNDGPAIVLEGVEQKELREKVNDVIKSNKKLDGIKGVFFIERFPVDIRHNIKIDRLKLADIVMEKSV